MVIAACCFVNGQYAMSLICPFCTREITLNATECPWCGTSYGADTRKFIRRAIGDQQQEGQDSKALTPRTHRLFKVSYPTARALARSYLSVPEDGGLYIRINNPPKKGERFRLRISLPNGGKDFEVWCEVAWAQRGENGGATEGDCSGVAVKFLDLSREGKEAIMAVLGRSGH